MELTFNRYRLELFKKTLSPEDYQYLYNKKIVAEGLFKIERRGDRVFLTSSIKRTKFESFSSGVGEELSDNLVSMYDDLVKKIKERKKG